jgi:hypothetical protein
MDKLRKLGDEFIKTVSSMYDDAHVSIPLTLSYIFDRCDKELGVKVYWSQNETPREERTMSRFSRSNEEATFLKNNRVGSSEARYFVTSTGTISKDRALEKVGEEFAASEDKGLVRLLKSKNQPENFCSLKIQTNSKVFYNDSFHKLCCTPDGIAFIDGILCPVELHTTKVAMRMMGNSRSNSLKKMLKGENNKIELLANFTKEQLHIKQVNKMKRDNKNKDPTFSPFRKPAKPNKANSDVALDRSRSRDKSISVLSGPYSENKFEARSDGQSSRAVLNLFNFQEVPVETMPYDKRVQLQTQMACMRAHKGVLIDWRENGIHFCIADRLRTTYSAANTVNSNISNPNF